MTGKRRIQHLLAIDWDSRTLRVVHAAVTKRGVKIDRLLAVGIPSDVDAADPQAMGRHIRRVLDQEAIRTKHAIVDIPRDQAILKTLKLPVQDRDALPGMVEIQIAKELPFPVSQAVIDFAVEEPRGAETEEPQESPIGDVLVAVVRQEVLAQYIDTFTAAGLKLDRVGLRPYANKVAACRQLQYALPERMLFIDVGPSLTEIDVIRQSALVFSRAASVNIPRDVDRNAPLSLVRSEPAGEEEKGGMLGAGAAPPAEAAPAGSGASIVGALLMEVTRSIEAYRAGDPGSAIDQVIIAGDVGIEDLLAEALQKRLGVSAELYNPATTFGWEPDEGADASAFAATLGLVLGQAEDGVLHLDFLHPKQRESATRKRLRKAPMAAAVVVLFSTAGMVALAKFTEDDRRNLAKIEARIDELEAQRSEFRKFLEMVEEVRAFDTKQHVWVDVMYEIFSQLPDHKELVVNQLSLQQDKDLVVLKTQAKDRDIPVQLIRKLEAFRREGRELPRFKATMGPQKERQSDRYPFSQDLRIEILNDGPKREGAGSST